MVNDPLITINRSFSIADIYNNKKRTYELELLTGAGFLPDRKTGSRFYILLKPVIGNEKNGTGLKCIVQILNSN